MNKEKIGMLKEKYRRGVGMMIINKNQEIFIGQRFEKDKSAWQMPQGGIDKGEKTVDAVKREMHEETGIKKTSKYFMKLRYGITINCLFIYRKNYGVESL